jgi:hypothetical protein
MEPDLVEIEFDDAAIAETLSEAGGDDAARAEAMAELAEFLDGHPEAE